MVEMTSSGIHLPRVASVSRTAISWSAADGTRVVDELRRFGKGVSTAQ
jgi:hypothetical protein